MAMILIGGSPIISLFNSPLHVDTVTKLMIKMRPLSTDGAILILVIMAGIFDNG